MTPNLAVFAAQIKRNLYDELRQNLMPSQGRFEADLLRSAQDKAAPQMGATRFTPSTITVEFIYPDPASIPIVIAVEIDAPERIVYLPVPRWVIEDVWQGEVAGRFVFESEADAYMESLAESLKPENNAPLFEIRPPKRKD